MWCTYSWIIAFSEAQLMWAGAGRICTGNASALLELDCLVPPWFDKKASLFKLNGIRTNYTHPEVVVNCSLCTAHSIFFCLFCAFVFVSTCSLKSIFSKKRGSCNKHSGNYKHGIDYYAFIVHLRVLQVALGKQIRRNWNKHGATASGG